MSKIVSSEIIEDSPQADSRRYVRYRFAIEDNNLNTESVEIGPMLVPADFDAVSDKTNREQTVLSQVVNTEKQTFASDLRGSINPFTTRSLRHHTRAEMLNFVLSIFLSEKLPPDVLAFGAGFLDKVTDDEMKAILGITDAKVTQIRNWQNTFKSHKTDWDNYAPPLGGS